MDRLAVPCLAAAALLAVAAVTGAASLAPEADAASASPAAQVRAGAAPGEVRCGDGFALVLRPDGRSACVHPATADRMEARGWEVLLPAAVPGDPRHAQNPPGVSHDDDDGGGGGGGDTAVPDTPVPNASSPVHPIPESISAASNLFAVDFYRRVSGDGADNHFFSPLGMFTAFSMLYEGARGQTAGQLDDAFGFDEDTAARHNATARMISSVNRDDPDAELVLANALWISDSYEDAIRDEYVDTARRVYAAAVNAVSFTERTGPENEIEGVRLINEWAGENTNGRINDVISDDSVSSLTAAVINNAIYFKGMWLHAFDENMTRMSDFWTADGPVDADFMRKTVRLDYAEYDDAQVLRLPYRGDRLSMVVALPAERGGLAALEAEMTAGLVDRWNQDMSDTEVYALIPKFEMKTRYDLKPPLADAGVTDVFSESDANLTGMAGIPLFVSTATQDAYVKVNEEGTEAAAVTTMDDRATSAPPPPTEFVADHPFLFAIQDDESGAILFMGRVADPTKLR